MALKSKTQKKSSDDLGIRPVSEIKHSGSYAIYGRSGSGKTTLSSTFPKPLLLLDIRDKGTDSIADVAKVDVKDIESVEDIEDVYHYLLDNPKKYKTVVFDTVTELQKLVMKKVVQAKGKKKIDEGRIGDWGTMAKRDWGDVAAEMNGWISAFRDLPMEVVFLAQERVRGGDDDDDDNQLAPEVGPAIMPSISNTLNAAVHVIGNTFVRMKTTTKEVKGKKTKVQRPMYCLRVGPSPVYVTKIRKPRSTTAPDYIENPTYDEIVSVIKGELE
jgi:phage nucleotide-binding protein